MENRNEPRAAVTTVTRAETDALRDRCDEIISSGQDTDGLAADIKRISAALLRMTDEVDEFLNRR